MSTTNSVSPKNWSLQSFYPSQEIQRQALLALQKAQHRLPPSLQKQSDQVQKAALAAMATASVVALVTLTRCTYNRLTTSNNTKLKLPILGSEGSAADRPTDPTAHNPTDPTAHNPTVPTAHNPTVPTAHSPMVPKEPSSHTSRDSSSTSTEPTPRKEEETPNQNPNTSSGPRQPKGKGKRRR